MTTERNPWSEARIKAGFDRFIAENGRLPTAPEVDRCDYLPAARSIQRTFGGLRALREKLGYEDVDFGVGKHRSVIAKRVNSGGIDAEIALEATLSELFGQVFVHTQRRYGNGKTRFDFVVYTKGYTFGIDIFHTSTTRDMQKNINLKMEKYGDINDACDLYFVVSSETLSQSDITSAIVNMRKINSRKNIKVMHVDEFLIEVAKYQCINDLVEVVNYDPYGNIPI